MNTNKEVEWRRFIESEKVEQINDHLFIDTYKFKFKVKFSIIGVGAGSQCNPNQI